MLREYSWDNISQVKALCSDVHLAPDNIAQEKILFNVVIIFLGQYCIGKNFVQCYPGIAQENSRANFEDCKTRL